MDPQPMEPQPMDPQPMELFVTCDKRDDRTLIHVQGELDLHTSGVLRSQAERMLPFTAPVTIDIGEVGFIDSTGIRCLLVVNNHAIEGTGQALVVQGASDISRKLFALTGIDRVFTVIN